LSSLELNKNVLWSMKWKDLQNRREDVIIIPIGSNEPHAWHLPLGTDTFCALKVALDAAEKTNSIVTPPIWFGWSIQHMKFPGTVNIRPEILIELVVDIIKSLSQNGFNKFILINGHRISNNPWLELAAAKARDEAKVKVVPIDIAYIAREEYARLGFGPLGHADEAETSHMLYIYPDLVDMEKAFDKYMPQQRLYNVDPRSTKDTILYTPSDPEINYSRKDITGGGSGNPKEASKEKGKELHEYTVKRVVEVIELLKVEGAKQEV